MRPHPDIDLLALHALGEPVLDPPATAHLGICARCSSTVSSLTETVLVARGPVATDPPSPVAVPAHVWQGIATELGLDPAVRPASVGPSSLRVRPATLTGVPPAAEGPRPTATGTATGPATGVTGGRRHGSALRLLAVAAAGLAVGAAGTALVAPRVSDGRPGGRTPQPAVLAAADLEAFDAGEGSDATGSARLAALPRTAGGTGDPGDVEDRVLQVRLDGLPDTGDDFLEAWLIDPDSGAMVSLGPVRAGGPGGVTAELAVPRGLDTGAYDLVDVSAEPLDGDPTHSGVSLVRGTLGT